MDNEIFTLEKIEENYLIFNKPENVDFQKAKDYLFRFNVSVISHILSQKSAKVLEISLEMLENKNENFQLLASIVIINNLIQTIYQFLKEKFKEISEDIECFLVNDKVKNENLINLIEIPDSKKENFLQIRDNIFLRMKKLLTMSHASPKTIERLCFCISIIMIMGIINYWTTCVEDIITFGKGSLENAWVALTIFANIKNELENISYKFSIRSKVISTH